MLSAQFVQQLDPPVYWGALAFVILFSIGSLWFFAHHLRIARLIKDTPTSKIRSAAQGFVELEGIGRTLKHPILSPLSRTPCLWYRFSIERKEDNGKTTSWRTIQRGQHPGPILMEDPTGQCMLSIKGASIHTSLKSTWSGSSPYPTELSIKRKESFLQFGDYRYTEELIIESSPIYALGYFKTLRAIDSHKHDSAVNKLIATWKKDYDQLLARFDRNGDGSLDMKEWKLVRLAAQLEAQDIKDQLASQPEQHIMEKHKGLPYIIGTDDQTGIAKRYFWMGLGFLVLFLICIVALADLINLAPTTLNPTRPS
ncbi:MAG: hypothetical protein HWE18_10040 [Gammaproteobacteria bacterium]|nr:hypothetical protein [Gammaproteobacteria bacterium]